MVLCRILIWIWSLLTCRHRVPGSTYLQRHSYLTMASCVKARLSQLPLFRVTVILFEIFFDLGATKWSELTHYFPPSRTDVKRTSQGHVHMAKHIRHVHKWPRFSSTAHKAVILALRVLCGLFRGAQVHFVHLESLIRTAGSGEDFLF